MAEASPNVQLEETTSTFPEPTANGANMDIDMKDDAPASTEQNHAVDPPTPTAAPTTPLPHQNTAATTARSSPHPGQTNAAVQQPPAHPNPHGSPTRVYLNQNVTPHLLEAMKHLATQEPEKPLKWLSEFLAEKSKEIEGI